MSLIYTEGKRLSGVIYMHRILDTRMIGLPFESFDFFRKLCEDAAMKKVVVTTVMWDVVTEQAGERTQRELAILPPFNKALEHGAVLERHNNTASSAREIVRKLVENTPMSLQLQHEMIDDRKPLPQTAIGIGLKSKLEEQLQRVERDIKKFRPDIRYINLKQRWFSFVKPWDCQDMGIKEILAPLVGMCSGFETFFSVFLAYRLQDVVL